MVIGKLRHWSWILARISLVALVACGCGASRPPREPDAVPSLKNALLFSSRPAHAAPATALPLVHHHHSDRSIPELAADVVFRSMQPELLACYAKRLETAARAHGSITIDVVVGHDGRARDIATTGGALLGDAVMSCIIRRVRHASFAPPAGGGTSRLSVLFSFTPDETR